MLLATMPELSSQEKRVGRHHTRVAHCVRSQQSSYLRFRLQFSGKAAVIAKVRLTFAQTVNAATEYHVFLTPKGDCKGPYVANETRDGFEVHELGGGQSHVAFDYRIVARRKGYKSIRLADKTQQFTSKTHDERHPSPWVPSGDVHNDVAHDFSALDDLVRLGDALKR